MLSRTEKILSAIIIILVIAQVFTVYTITKNQEVTAQQLLLLKTESQQGDTQLQQSLDNQSMQLLHAIESTQTNLSGIISGVQTSLEASQQQFSTQISNLESSQEETRNNLEDSIRNLRTSSQDVSQVVNDILPSVVSVLTDRGEGSGVIVDNRGLVMTNDHVIKGAQFIRVLTKDGTLYTATLIGTHDTRDLAVIGIDSTKIFPSLQFTNRVIAGEKVIAAGNPGGLGFSVTEGIISATDRQIQGKKYIQLSAAINPGNSGGPVVNLDGKIIGINTIKISGFEGIGFAIPSSDAEDMLEQVRAYLETVNG